MELKDKSDELLKSLNILLTSGRPFAITTCRSGLAIDIYDGDTSYLDKQSGKRIAYTTDNDDCLGKTIREAITKGRK